MTLSDRIEAEIRTREAGDVSEREKWTVWTLRTALAGLRRVGL